MVDVQPLLRVDRGVFGGMRLRLNSFLTKHLGLIAAGGFRLTIFDSYRALGDTLMTGIVCRLFKRRFPSLKINCITPYPELLERDPNIGSLNEPETFFCVWFQYAEILDARDGGRRLVDPVLARAGIRDYELSGCVYLADEERREAVERVGRAGKPFLSVNTLTKEPSKNWPEAAWRELVSGLIEEYEVLHLGGPEEPVLDGVRRFAGTLTLRESMAVLACVEIHVGGDSFLAHAAAGLSVPSVVILGGSRGVANVAYSGSVVLGTEIECGPCFLQEVRDERCPHHHRCLAEITVGRVREAVFRVANAERRGG
jgi:ADP-heptose:LPS heptosyltransferase